MSWVFSKINNKKLESARKKVRNAEMTRHHILNRCRTDLFKNLNDEENIKDLPRRPHETRHMNQENNAPHETLKDLERMTQVMSPKAQELYNLLLEIPIEEFYKAKFLKK